MAAPKPLTGASFVAAFRADAARQDPKVILDPADEVLLEAIGRCIDDAAATKSARERVTIQRLLGELVTRLDQRRPVVGALSASDVGRMGAAARWNRAAS